MKNRGQSNLSLLFMRKATLPLAVSTNIWCSDDTAESGKHGSS